jgi:magnesium chelatase subunit I
VATRVDVVKRRIAYERDPAAFHKAYKRKDGRLRSKIKAGRERLDDVEVPDDVLESAAGLCMKLGTDGLRGELSLVRAARAVAAFEGAASVDEHYLERVAPLALRHRFRRDPLDEAGSTARVERALREHFGE